MESKVISINFDVMKAKAKEAALNVRSGILSKGIELSKKQLTALEKVKKNLG